MIETPTGTVTFLFTDIEGSTRLWEAQPDAMVADLAAHDRLVRGALEGAGGYVFATAGDGFAVAFDSPSTAVEAAISAQVELLRDGPAGLRVRMGLHTGEATVRGGDYFGATVNRAARVMAVGYGGQILISSTSADALSGSVPTKSLGQHRLKDLGEPLGVHQVLADGLPAEFPPLRSLNTVAGNLPQRLSSFVGRDAERRNVVDQIAEHRHVTLIGVGGTGKTRLALEAAAELGPDFADGVWLIELGPVGDPAGVLERVMSALGIQMMQGVTNEDRISEYLAERSLLLIVDNCEHLLGPAADLVEQVLRAGAGTKVIATSREPLMSAGEQLVAVPSLRLGDKAGKGGEAVALFVERARSERAQFVLDEETFPAVLEICTRLDGVPLAIELAASRSRSMDVHDIVRRLDERFRLLTGGRRTTAERHQTLQATVDWSYELLNESERLVFNRLSVFSGWFDLTDGSSVCVDDELDELDVVDAMSSLVDKSMCVLAADHHPGSYRLLETLRAYGHAQLLASGELEHRRLRHAQHYLGRLADAHGRLMGPDEVSAAQWCRSAAVELRAALIWAANAGEIDLVTESLSTLGPLGWRGWLEPHEWVAEIAHLLPQDHQTLAVLVTRALTVEGDIARTRELAEKALEYDDADDALGYIYFHWAFSYLMTGEFDEALRLARRSFELGEASGLTEGAMAGRFVYSSIQSMLGIDDAGMGRRVLERAREIKWPSGQVAGHYLVGRSLIASDPAGASRSFSEAVDLAADIGNVQIGTIASRELWALQLTYESVENLASMGIEILRTFIDMGNTLDLMLTLAHLSDIFDRTQNHEPVAAIAGFAGMRARPDADAAGRMDAAIENAKNQLGAQFSALEERGSAATAAEIVHYVVSHLEQLTGAPAAPAGDFG